MDSLLCLSVLLAFLCGNASTAGPRGHTKIPLILSDDLGYAAVGLELKPEWKLDWGGTCCHS